MAFNWNFGMDQDTLAEVVGAACTTAGVNLLNKVVVDKVAAKVPASIRPYMAPALLAAGSGLARTNMNLNSSWARGAVKGVQIGAMAKIAEDGVNYLAKSVGLVQQGAVIPLRGVTASSARPAGVPVMPARVLEI